MTSSERGSATVESVFAIVMLLLVALGALQVAFVLYARNVLMSAAHEGVRAAVEREAVENDAVSVAAAVVERAAGGLVDDLDVDATAASAGSRELLTVRVRGTVSAFGPVPVAIPVNVTATSVRDDVTT